MCVCGVGGKVHTARVRVDNSEAVREAVDGEDLIRWREAFRDGDSE